MFAAQALSDVASDLLVAAERHIKDESLWQRVKDQEQDRRRIELLS